MEKKEKEVVSINLEHVEHVKNEMLMKNYVPGNLIYRVLVHVLVVLLYCTW